MFIVGVGSSLLIPYLLMSGNEIPVRLWFLRFFIKFSLIALPIFTIWLGLLLSKGKWREIKDHIRALIVFIAIFLVSSFCIFKWTSTVNTYGIYGHYIKNAEATEDFFRNYTIDKDSTSFEKEATYRELMKSIYDLEFKKMWTFSAFVFLSAFLLLNVAPKKKE